MRSRQKKDISREDILRLDNVPVALAAQYIGSSTATIYRALQEERAPFGFASCNPNGGWAYNISPGALVRYKEGNMAFWKLREVEEIAVDGIERLLHTRMEAAQRAVEAALAMEAGSYGV